MNTFADNVKQEYGVTIPFHPGSFEAAHRDSQDDVAFLVLYFHCPTHEDTAGFLHHVLGDDEVIAHLSQQSILCGVSVMESDGWRLAGDFGVTTFPCVMVLFKKEVLMRLQGPYTKAEFLHEWEVCSSFWSGVVAEEVSYRHERELREQQRLQEEHAVAEMEQADKERLAQIERNLEEQREAAARAREAQEALERKQREEEEKEREAAEARTREEARRQAEALERKKMAARLAESARERLPPEPPADAAASDVALISVRDLHGRQHQRRFYRSDCVDAVLNFAISVEEDYDGSALNLVAGFPPKPLEWSSGETRIGDVTALCPRSVVTVRKA